MSLKCIEDRWEEIKLYTTFKKEFCEAVEFCLNSTYFTFNSECSKQIFDTAMGSPIPCNVVNIIMNFRTISSQFLRYKIYLNGSLTTAFFVYQLMIFKTSQKNSMISITNYSLLLKMTMTIKLTFLIYLILWRKEKLKIRWYIEDVWLDRFKISSRTYH